MFWVTQLILQMHLNHTTNAVKPEYNDHPWGLYKVAVVLRWPLFRGCSSKISISYGWMGFWPVVVDRWLLTQVWLFIQKFFALLLLHVLGYGVVLFSINCRGVLACTWTPGTFLSAKKASPPKSFEVMTSWSKMEKRNMASSIRHWSEKAGLKSSLNVTA